MVYISTHPEGNSGLVSVRAFLSTRWPQKPRRKIMYLLKWGQDLQPLLCYHGCSVPLSVTGRPPPRSDLWGQGILTVAVVLSSHTTGLQPLWGLAFSSGHYQHSTSWCPQMAGSTDLCFFLVPRNSLPFHSLYTVSSTCLAFTEQRKGCYLISRLWNYQR